VQQSHIDQTNLTICESVGQPGVYQVFCGSRIILEFQKHKKGVLITRNDLGVSTEEVKMHIEAYLDDASSILYYIAKLRLRSIRKFTRALRNAMGFLDEESLLDAFRRLKYMEDIHK